MTIFWSVSNFRLVDYSIKQDNWVIIPSLQSISGRGPFSKGHLLIEKISILSNEL